MLRTDNEAIQWLKNFKEPTSQLVRWFERLSAYDFIVQHRPGRKHLNADALSRTSTIDICLAIAEEAKDLFDMRLEQEKDKFLTRIKK